MISAISTTNLLLPSPLGTIAIRGAHDGVQIVEFLDAIPWRGVPDNPDPVPEPVRACADQLAAYFRGELQEFDVPLAVAGTQFERRVWRTLLTIPFGTTWTYADLAHSLGDDKAIRAVGRANGKNPVSIVVPCHRVIGSDGSLIGYGGGLWRKAWLLNHEGRPVQPYLFRE